MTDTASTSAEPNTPPLHALITAGALLLLYVGLTIAMMAWFAGKTGTLWDHALLIYNGFTGFAVAAGGVLLGTQIQQANVASARRTADRAQREEGRVKRLAGAALAATGEPTELTRGGQDVTRVRSLLTEALTPDAGVKP